MHSDRESIEVVTQSNKSTDMARLKLLSVLLCILFIDVSEGGAKVVFDATTWTGALGWCIQPNEQLFIGDFNGDGRQDVLCHNPQNGYKSIRYASCNGNFKDNGWSRNLGYCYGKGHRLFIGDFNGDGRSDLLCHNIKTGYKWVSLADFRGHFSATSWEHAMGWCIGAPSQLLIADFNADGRDDMMCHDVAGGYKWISYANQDGSFSGTGWELAMGWCIQTDLLTGDFNGDRRADILCHDAFTGYTWVALASASGTFSTTSWEADLGWCNYNTANLEIGDFNKDNRADMLCHDVNGNKKIAFASASGTFSGANWQKELDWCREDNLFIADVNGDGGDDMVCHHKSSEDGSLRVTLNKYGTT